MSIRVDEVGEPTTEEVQGELIKTTYTTEDNWDYTDDGENGPEQFAYKRINHVPKFPEGSWLHNWALPIGTVFEVRQMDETHHYQGRKNPVVFTGRLLRITAAYLGDDEYDDESPVIEDYTIDTMQPHAGEYPSPRDYYWRVSMMNSAKLPDGRVIVFPWGNGTTPFEGERIDLMQDLVVGDMTIYGTAKPVSEEMWPTVEPGSIVLNGDFTSYIVVGRDEEGDPILKTLDDTTSPETLASHITNAIRFSADISTETEGVDAFAWEEDFRLIGKFPVPSVTDIGSPVAVADLRPGDVVVGVHYGERYMFGIRWNGFPTGSSQRRLKGVRYNSPTDEVFLDAASYRQWGELNQNGWTWYVVGHQEMPIGALEDGATFEQWLESGIELDTRYMDANDAERFVSAFTPEILANLKAAGITHINPTGWLNESGITARHRDPPAGVFSIYPLLEPGSTVAPGVDNTIENIQHPEGTGRRLMIPQWHTYPGSAATMEAASEVRDHYFAVPLSAYYPSVKAIMFGLSPYHMRSMDIPYFREVLLKCSRQAATLAEEWVNGTFRRKASEAMFQRNLQRTFGLSALPDEMSLIIENQLVRVRPAKDNETADVMLKGRGFVVIAQVGELDNQVRRIFDIVQGTEVAAKNILRGKLEVIGREIRDEVNNTYVTPTLGDLRRAVNEAEDAVYKQHSRLTKLQEEFRGELGGMAALAAQFAQVYTFANGLTKSVLPVGNGWYTRIAPGGFIEACLDTVKWTDLVAGCQIETPIELRIRIYYDIELGLWRVLPYSESVYAKAGVPLHPHIQPEGWQQHMHMAFPEVNLSDPNNRYLRPNSVAFCFGAAKTQQPEHSQLLPFMKELREYLFAVNRVMLSVQAVDGFRSTEHIASMLSSGFASSPMSYVQVCESLRLTRQAAHAGIERGISLHAEVVRISRLLGREPPSLPEWVPRPKSETEVVTVGA